MANILIYSTPSCVYCKMTKDFLGSHNIPFREVNVAEDDAARDEMIQKSGQLGVPVIDVDGQIFVGFDQKGLTKVLGLDSAMPKAA